MTNESVSVRHITIDCFANIYEVVMMYDRYAHPTRDPSLASTCVLKCGQNYISQNADDIPIYTVH
jgi:hypothetical protein